MAIQTYALVDQAGNLVQYRDFDGVPENPAGKPWTWHSVTDVEGGTDGLNGVVWERGVPVPRVPTYKEKRSRGYPHLGDQLDTIWKHLELGGLAPNENAAVDTPEKMLADIKAVKAKYPKP